MSIDVLIWDLGWTTTYGFSSMDEDETSVLLNGQLVVMHGQLIVDEWITNSAWQITRGMWDKMKPIVDKCIIEQEEYDE